jgi:hypothetical protein
MRIFGLILAIWTFLLAGGIIICAIHMTNTGQCPTDVVNKIMEYLTRE